MITIQTMHLSACQHHQGTRSTLAINWQNSKLQQHNIHQRVKTSPGEQAYNSTVYSVTVISWLCYQFVKQKYCDSTWGNILQVNNQSEGSIEVEVGQSQLALFCLTAMQGKVSLIYSRSHHPPPHFLYISCGNLLCLYLNLL